MRSRALIEAASSGRRLAAATLGSVLAVLLLSAACLGAIPEGWVSLDRVSPAPTAPSMEVLSSSSSALTMEVSLPGFICEPMVHDGVSYDRLALPGYGRTEGVGTPWLPVVRQLIAIPEGAHVIVDVELGEPVILDDCLPYPMPRTVRDGDRLRHEFARDPASYSQRGYYPSEPAAVEMTGSLRGQGVALIAFRPMQYDPFTRALRVYPKATLNVGFSGGRGSIGEPIGPLGVAARAVMPNYEGGGGPSRESGGPGAYAVCTTVAQCASLGADYLFIVDDAYCGSDYVEDLAEHRTVYNGYNVAIVSEATVVSQTGNQVISAQAIKDFVQDVYDSTPAEHMLDGKLGYVLLIGDARAGEPNDYLPAYERPHGEEPTTTDHWYACVDGDDPIADVLLGRIAIQSEDRLGRQVERTISYELTADSSEPWRSRGLLGCGFAWEGEPGQCPYPCDPGDEGLYDSAVASYVDIMTDYTPDGYTVQDLYACLLDEPPCCDQYAALEDAVVDAVNGVGAHIVQLNMHGGVHGGWGFGWEAVCGDGETLDNTGQLPFWMNFSCSTGAYDRNDPNMDPEFQWQCAGELLLHARESSGAIGFFGATEPNSGAFGLSRWVWEGLSLGRAHVAGQFLAYGKLKWFSLSGTARVIDEIHTYNLLGDPALNIMLDDASGYASMPDLIVEPADLSTVSHGNGSISLRAMVRNESNYNMAEAAHVRMSVCEQDGSECEALDPLPVTIPAWDVAHVEAVWTPAQDHSDVGRKTLKVELDCYETTDELFEDNNVAETPFGVYFDSYGFPADVRADGGLSPIAVDLVGSEVDELLVSGRVPGRVQLLSSPAALVWEFEAPGGDTLRGDPAVADLDGDGADEVVVCYGDYVMALNGANGQDFWSAARYVKGLKSGAVVGDVDGDGAQEVLVESTVEVGELPKHRCLLLSSDGASEIWSYEKIGSYDRGYFPPSSPALCDLDYDGDLDAVSSFYCVGSRGGSMMASSYLAAIDGSDGSQLWLSLIDTPVMGYAGPPANPVVTDVVSSYPGPEILCGAMRLLAYRSTGDLFWAAGLDGHATGLSIDDLDDDAMTDIIVVTQDIANDRIGHLEIFEYGPTAPVATMQLEGGGLGEATLGDLDGDENPEMFVVSGSRFWEGPIEREYSSLEILTYDPIAQEISDFGIDPLFFWGGEPAPPTLANVDKDLTIEALMTDPEGMFHCLKYWEDGGRLLKWSCVQHDARRTGRYETPVSGPYPPGSSVAWWGDYVMTGDVTIDDTSVLKIEPGTTIRATPNSDDQASGLDAQRVELIVDGTLDARGDDVSLTTFRSDADDPAPGDWYGVRLGTGSTGTLDECRVKHGFVAVNATSPDSFCVSGCTFLDNMVVGIACGGDSGRASVSITDNLVSFSSLGIGLTHCDGVVEGNTVRNCSVYGMTCIQDEGSEIRGNLVQASTKYQLDPIAGIYVVGSKADLTIEDNEIIDVHDCGIWYQDSQDGDDCLITGNTIVDNEIVTGSKGMYFNEGCPTVRWNTIDGKKNGFWVESGMTAKPDLGNTATSDGNNSVDSADAKYCVYVRFGSIVRAENNWWGTPTPHPKKFTMLADWNPYLTSPPSRGLALDGYEDEILPSRAEVLNSPNPFNPSTVINYTVPSRGYVTLAIYDVAGRCVSVLFEGEQGPGWHQNTWDGRASGGERVASGVYFCRLSTGTETVTKKLALLK